MSTISAAKALDHLNAIQTIPSTELWKYSGVVDENGKAHTIEKTSKLGILFLKFLNFFRNSEKMRDTMAMSYLLKIQEKIKVKDLVEDHTTATLLLEDKASDRHSLLIHLSGVQQRNPKVFQRVFNGFYAITIEPAIAIANSSPAEQKRVLEQLP